MHGERTLPCQGKRSNLDKPLNETNAQTNKRRNNKQQQERLAGNGSTESCNPRYSGIYEGGNGGENISHRNTPSDPDQSLNETNTEPDKGHDDKTKKQGIRSDDSNKGANPL